MEKTSIFYILVTFLDTTAQERREAGKMLVLYKEIESRDLMPPPDGNQSDCSPRAEMGSLGQSETGVITGPNGLWVLSLNGISHLGVQGLPRRTLWICSVHFSAGACLAHAVNVHQTDYPSR